MIKKINHIGIVVDDFEKGKEMYGAYLGLRHLKDEVTPAFGCEIAFYQCGEVMVELIHPIGSGQSWDFLRDHGPGIHHICYEVDDINETFNTVTKYFTTDYTEPRIGAGGCQIFFLDPSSIGNVETEFSSG